MEFDKKRACVFFRGPGGRVGREIRIGRNQKAIELWVLKQLAYLCMSPRYEV